MKFDLKLFIETGIGGIQLGTRLSVVVSRLGEPVGWMDSSSGTGGCLDDYREADMWYYWDSQVGFSNDGEFIRALLFWPKEEDPELLFWPKEEDRVSGPFPGNTPTELYGQLKCLVENGDFTIEQAWYFEDGSKVIIGDRITFLCCRPHGYWKCVQVQVFDSVSDRDKSLQPISLYKKEISFHPALDECALDKKWPY
jgi:hypothetical protein